MNGAGPRLASLLFVGFFPGFFLYHILGGLGTIPLFLGSWWSWWNVIAVTLLAPFVVANIATTKQWKIHLPVLFLMANVALVAAYFHFQGEDWQRRPEPFLAAIKLLIAWGGLYCVGFLLKGTEALGWVLSLSLIAMAACVFIFTDPSLTSFNPAGWTDAPKGTAGYQWFAMAVLFTAIGAFSFARSDLWRIGVLAVATATLYLIGARSEIVGMLAIAGGWLALAAWRLHWRLAIVGAAVVAVAGLCAHQYPQMLLEMQPPEIAQDVLPETPAVPEIAQDVLPQTPAVPDQPVPVLPDEVAPGTQVAQRYAEMSDLANSPSWQQRMEFFWSGWNAVKASPLIGDFAGQIRDHQKFGAYVHNGFLGVWRDFGLLALVLFSFMTIAATLTALWQVVVKGSTAPMWYMTLCVSGVTLLLAAITKGVYWPLPAMAWGLAAARAVESSKAHKT